MTREDGVDNYNVSGVPFTFEREVLRHDTRAFLEMVEGYDRIVEGFKTRAQHYVAERREGMEWYGGLLLCAFPGSVLWLLLVIVPLVLGVYYAGVGWVLAIWFGMAWCATLLLAVGFSALNFSRGDTEPFGKAVTDAAGWVFAASLLLLLGPALVAPFVLAQLFLRVTSSPALIADADTKKAKRAMEDTRARVAMAFLASVKAMNHLAMVVRNQRRMISTGVRRATRDQEQKLEEIEDTLRGMRARAFRLLEFLDSSIHLGALGTYAEDPSDIIIWNQEMLERANDILGEDELRRDAAIDFARLVASSHRQ